jgi:hypothetical protein
MLTPTRWFVAAILAITVASCGSTLDPEDVPGAIPFEAPAFYHDLWDQVQACAVRTGELDRIRWYEVPDAFTFDVRGSASAGYWWPSREIVLTGMFAHDPVTVRHEMLHDLLGTGSHPAESFVTRCGHLVTLAGP